MGRAVGCAPYTWALGSFRETWKGFVIFKILTLKAILVSHPPIHIVLAIREFPLGATLVMRSRFNPLHKLPLHGENLRLPVT